MAEIQLPNNFYVDCKPRYYRLCERYIGKTKDGEPKQSIRRYGNHNNLQSALHEFLERNTLNGLQAVEIWDMGKLVDKLNKDAVYKLEQILKGVQENEV